jgi:hypothetical protein
MDGAEPMTFLLRIVLAAGLLQLAPAFAQSPKNAPKNAPAALQKDFDGFIAKFRTALTANDAAAVAGMTRLPFMNEASISDAAQFREKIYKPDFTAKNRACIQRGKAVYDRDGENNDNFFIFCGEKIFVFTNTPAGFVFTDIGAND